MLSFTLFAARASPQRRVPSQTSIRIIVAINRADCEQRKCVPWGGKRGTVMSGERTPIVYLSFPSEAKTRFCWSSYFAMISPVFPLCPLAAAASAPANTNKVSSAPQKRNWCLTRMIFHPAGIFIQQNVVVGSRANFTTRTHSGCEREHWNSCGHHTT